jgi:carbamoyl-phosphate synthase large subunit
MENRLCVLVTGVGGRSVGHQILSALKILGDKYRFVVTDSDHFSAGLYQVPNRYVVPHASTTKYIDAIRSILLRESVDVVIPGTEVELYTLAKNREILADLRCTLIANPTNIIDLCKNKAVLYDWLNTNGVAVPKTVSAKDYQELVAKVGWPIVGKPTESTGASRNVAILCNKIEVENYIVEAEMNKIELIFQEYIGSPDGEYTVGVMISKHGEAIDSIVVHRKLIGLSMGIQRTIKGHHFALSTGYSQGFVIRHEEIQAFCENLACKIGIIGPANIQLRLHQGKMIIFEVHPRFSGTTSIRALVGFNEPDVLIRHFHSGEEFGRLNYQHNVAAIRSFHNTIVPLSVMDAIPCLDGNP